MVWPPELDVPPWLTTPVAVFVAVTVAPAMTAPVLSVTVPVIPLVAWPCARGSEESRRAKHVSTQNPLAKRELTTPRIENVLISRSLKSRYLPTGLFQNWPTTKRRPRYLPSWGCHGL